MSITLHLSGSTSGLSREPWLAECWLVSMVGDLQQRASCADLAARAWAWGS